MAVCKLDYSMSNQGISIETPQNFGVRQPEYQIEKYSAVVLWCPFSGFYFQLYKADNTQISRKKILIK